MKKFLAILASSVVLFACSQHNEEVPATPADTTVVVPATETVAPVTTAESPVVADTTAAPAVVVDAAPAK